MKGITANFGLEKLRQITLSAESLAKEITLNNPASILKHKIYLKFGEETKSELKTKNGYLKNLIFYFS